MLRYSFSNVVLLCSLNDVSPKTKNSCPLLRYLKLYMVSESFSHPDKMASRLHRLGSWAITLLLSAFLLTPLSVRADDADKQGAAPIPYGTMQPELVEIGYVGDEYLAYDVSYTGGVKVGEIYFTISRREGGGPFIEIYMRATTDNGVFDWIYPIEDVHITHVRGPQRFPFRYEVFQKEGDGYEAHRLFIFDQQKGSVSYQLNGKNPRIITMGPDTHNEFSAFLATRVMQLIPNEPFIVPTFADDRRNEVKVMVKGTETLRKTMFGEIKTIIIEPILEFADIYEKRGDTVVWFTDDSCRVPVKVNSRLMIGSFTANLVAYRNPHCPAYDSVALERDGTRSSIAFYKNFHP